MLCERCGAANPDGDDVRFCRACGGRLDRALGEAGLTVAAGGVDGSRPSAAFDEIPPTDGGSIATLIPAAVDTVALARALAGPAAETDPLPPPRVLMMASPYGGFWARFGAYLIDYLALSAVGGVAYSVIVVALGLVTTVAAESESATSYFIAAMAFATLAGFLISLAYYVVLPPLAGATPGKLALGYEIVGPDCRRIGFWRSLGRFFAYFPSTIALFLGFFWIGVDSRGQGWHDKLAGTYVVRKEFVRR